MWDPPVGGAASYKVTLLDEYDIDVESSNTNETTITFSDLTAGQTYIATVIPYNIDGNGGLGNTSLASGTSKLLFSC